MEHNIQHINKYQKVVKNNLNIYLFCIIMFQRLEILKKKGYIPDTILDIGAYKGEWTRECKDIFPDAHYYLFDAQLYPELNDLLQSPLKIKVFQAVLNNVDKDVDWYKIKNTGDSMFKEQTHHYKDCQILKKSTTTLNKIINPYLSVMKNVFIKIDCQGAEIPILEGAGDILQKTDFILLEIPLFGQYNENVPNFLHHIQYMDKIGFIPFDIVEVHVIKDFSLQVDMLFISKTHPFNEDVQRSLMT